VQKQKVRLNIKVIPQSKLNQINEYIVNENGENSLKVRVTAKPEDGKANKAVIELISDYFNIPKSKFEIIKGLTNRNKVVSVDSEYANNLQKGLQRNLV
jgi:uncharacterized protein (TIGR00251 family)